MQRLIGIIILLVGLFAMLTLKASECTWGVGGYCVSAIVSDTARILTDTMGLKPAELKASLNVATNEGYLPTISHLEGGTNYYTFYENVWTEWVKAGLASEEEKVSAFNEAGNAGGTKIGGINLVVLAARTFQKMVDLKIMSLEQAQQILNGAKGQK